MAALAWPTTGLPRVHGAQCASPCVTARPRSPRRCAVHPSAASLASVAALGTLILPSTSSRPEPASVNVGWERRPADGDAAATTDLHHSEEFGDYLDKPALQPARKAHAPERQQKRSAHLVLVHRCCNEREISDPVFQRIVHSGAPFQQQHSHP